MSTDNRAKPSNRTNNKTYNRGLLPPSLLDLTKPNFVVLQMSESLIEFSLDPSQSLFKLLLRGHTYTLHVFSNLYKPFTITFFKLNETLVHQILETR
jgi:hypothetical protein